MSFYRSIRHLAVASVVFVGMSFGGHSAFALDNLTIIAPANPGGGWDQTARSMQAVMQETGIAKAATVENIPGAGGTIGLATLADKYKGSADTMMVGGLVMVGAVITNNAPVKLDAITPLARLTGEYEVLVVPASSPIKSLADLLAAFKADPGSVSWGGGSAGGTDHILAGLIAQASGVSGDKVNYVPFSGGGEALAAIMGGHVSVGVSGLGEWIGQIQSGELRALAISSPTRLEGVDIPTLKEQGVDVDLANWRGVVAAPGLDDAAKKALLDSVDQMVKSDAWKKVLAEKGWMDIYLPGDEFVKFLADENARVTETLKQIGLVK